MIDRVTKLADLVEQAAESLSKYKESEWATRLQLEVTKIRAGDFQAVEQILSTLPDLSSPSEILQQLRNRQNSLNASLNDTLYAESEKLYTLLSQITDLASWLKRESQRTA